MCCTNSRLMNTAMFNHHHRQLCRLLLKPPASRIPAFNLPPSLTALKTSFRTYLFLKVLGLCPNISFCTQKQIVGGGKHFHEASCDVSLH